MGSVFVVSGPSGAGKSTVTKAVAARHPDDVVLAVSATTREPRPGETNGREYFFVSGEEFDRARENGELLEWAEVHGARYGTLRATVEDALAKGKDVLLEIDVQGARSISKQMPEAVTIFILPPSIEVLEERLARRGTESKEALAGRLAEAAREVAAADEFAAIVINEDLETTVDQVDRILMESRRSQKT